MATLNREAIEQEIGKRFEKIEKTLERTLEKTLEKAIVKAAELANSPAATKAQAAAEVAREKAKKSIDDVLLGLEHKGYDVKGTQDLIQTVGRRVLERASDIAEDVRSQVAAKPYSPEWLKNVSIPRPSAAAPMKASTVDAGATEGDGELAESAEDSAEEKSAGTIVHSEPDVVSTSLAEASESNQAADFPTAGKTAPKAAKKAAKSSKK